MLGPGEIEFSLRYMAHMDPEDTPQWVPQMFIPWSSRRAVIRAMGCQEAMIGLVPRRPGGGFNEANCLWARLESTKNANALRRFRPAPTLVLREGRSIKRTAIWSLSTPLDLVWLERANARLSYRLGTKLKHGDVGAMFHAPASPLSGGKETWAEHISDASYSPREIVGMLRDRPQPSMDWRAAA
jgi:hypothetical protein